MHFFSSNFGKMKCGCEERRYSRSGLIYVARGQLTKRHVTVSVGFCFAQTALVMAEGYGLL